MFADGRRLELTNGKSARGLKPGVEVYDAAGKLLFRSRLEVLFVIVNGSVNSYMTSPSDLL